MIADSAGLDGRLAWMLEHRDQCPMVYAPDEEVEIQDAAPLLMPTAYNGVFVEYALNHDTVMFTGEFVDLDSGEIHTFTMDGFAQRMRYQSTGRTIRDGQEQARS